MKPAFSVFLDSVEDIFFALIILGEPSLYEPLSSKSIGKLLVPIDCAGVEVKNFAWSVGTLSLPLVGVASGIVDKLIGTASDDSCCGDGYNKPMLNIPTFLTAAIFKDGTAKS